MVKPKVCVSLIYIILYIETKDQWHYWQETWIKKGEGGKNEEQNMQVEGGWRDAQGMTYSMGMTKLVHQP